MGLMLLPVTFFTSVLLEQYSNNNFSMDYIFVPIDKTSGTFSALIMVGLPFLAFCINIVPLMNLEISRENVILKFSFEIKKKIFNLIIACLGLLTIIIILSYLFTENFRLR